MGKSYCQHCKIKQVARPKKLCWRCYYTPAINCLYEQTSKFGMRGINPGNKRSTPPPFPTDALPGSEEKIAVMQERALLGCSLDHDKDLKQKIVPHNGRESFNMKALGDNFIRDCEAAYKFALFHISAQIMQEK